MSTRSVPDTDTAVMHVPDVTPPELLAGVDRVYMSADVEECVVAEMDSDAWMDVAMVISDWMSELGQQYACDSDDVADIWERVGDGDSDTGSDSVSEGEAVYACRVESLSAVSSRVCDVLCEFVDAEQRLSRCASRRIVEGALRCGGHSQVGCRCLYGVVRSPSHQ